MLDNFVRIKPTGFNVLTERKESDFPDHYKITKYVDYDLKKTFKETLGQFRPQRVNWPNPLIAT
jgi:hypothetical protein